VELGRYLCEVRAGQYCRLEKLKGFDELLARRFPESPRKAYYLMSIHEYLPQQARREREEVGWTKGLEPTKVATRDGHQLDCVTWLHKARSLPKDQFKQEMERELTGRRIGTVGDYLLQVCRNFIFSYPEECRAEPHTA
jgi:hypothetical protein